MAAPAARRGRRVLSLSMVKNEQDIIEPFIRHTARLVDCMIILDNASVDETRRIAMDCARELGTVIVADSEEFGYTQSERMTRLLHQCQSGFFADFVLLLDADEFLGTETRAALLAALETIPPNGVGLLPWQTFVLAPGAVAATQDPPRSIRWRRAAETPPFRKAVLRLDGTHRPDLLIGQGNHGVVATDGEAPPAVHLDDLALLHFPVRSRHQFAAKGVVGWMAYLAKDPAARHKDQGFQWREAFDRIVSPGGGPDEIELCEISMRYAQNRPCVAWRSDAVAGEPPSDYVRRHSTGAFADPLSLIARSWERSLSPPPALLHLVRPPAATDTPGSAATSFDAAWHWDHLFVDVAPFRFLAEKHRPAQVLDVGCGIGAYLMLFKRLGAAGVFGVDGVPAEATVLAGDEYAARDLSEPLHLGRVFDLVVCVEVAEHLEAQHSEILLDNVARHAGRTIVFSAAEPGQPGHGHINCRPISHWLDRWASRGWYPDPVDSLGLRCLATMSWFRRNLVVLRRADPEAGAEAAALLAGIGAKPFVWYAQQPGIRHVPFSEPLPPPPAGYST